MSSIESVDGGVLGCLSKYKLVDYGWRSIGPNVAIMARGGKIKAVSGSRCGCNHAPLVLVQRF